MASILLDDAQGPLYARTTVDELEPAVRSDNGGAQFSEPDGGKGPLARAAPREALAHGQKAARG